MAWEITVVVPGEAGEQQHDELMDEIANLIYTKGAGKWDGFILSTKVADNEG